MSIAKYYVYQYVKNLWADPEYKAKRMEKVMQTRIKNGFSR